MIYIYNCYAGTHSSSIASDIHLGKVDDSRIPTKDEILSIGYFNELDKEDMGKIFYRGMDDEGSKVFTLGRGSSKIAVQAMVDLLGILQDEWGVEEKIIFSNMSPAVPMSMTVGGFISREFRLNFVGVPFLIIGTKQAFFKIAELVRFTRQAAKDSTDPILVLKNKL